MSEARIERERCRAIAQAEADKRYASGARGAYASSEEIAEAIVAGPPLSNDPSHQEVADFARAMLPEVPPEGGQASMHVPHEAITVGVDPGIADEYAGYTAMRYVAGDRIEVLFTGHLIDARRSK